MNIRPVKNYLEATVYLPIWRGNSGKEKETLCNSLDILMKGIDKEKTKSIAFDLIEIEKLGWPKMKYIKQILAMVQTQRPCVPIHLYERGEGQFKITTGIIEEVSLDIGHSKQGNSNKIVEYRIINMLCRIKLYMFDSKLEVNT